MKKNVHRYVKCILLSGMILLMHAGSRANPFHHEKLDSGAPKIKLKQALLDLQARYHVSILFEDKAIENFYISADVMDEKAGIEENLSSVLKPFNLHFQKEKQNAYIIITPQPHPKQAPTEGKISETLNTNVPVNSPENTIRGLVRDDKGLPLAGVSVSLEGTSYGTVTDNNGNFVLPIPSSITSGKILFSFIDFEQREYPFSGLEKIDISLRKNNAQLSDIVVVGYGTAKRKDLTGSVSSIRAKDIIEQPVAGIDQALQGSAAGVDVTSGSGAPGGSVSVKIRGIGTVGYSEPLYVVDGVPFINSVENSNVNILNTLNPNDIENIDILKDASATAIYGARGANGVVIITTKRGRAGKTIVNFDAYGGFQQVANKVKLLNASQFAQLDNEILINGGGLTDPGLSLNPDYSNPSSLGTGTNWLNELFRTAPIQSYNVSASGGNEKNQYAISAGFFDQDGVIINSDFKRYSVRLNLDSKLSESFKIGTSLSLSHTTQNAVMTDDDANPGSGLIYLAINQLPNLPVYREGTYAGPEGPIRWVGDKSNPVGRANVIEDHEDRSRLLGNVFADWKIVKGLTFRTNWGLDALYETSTNFEPEYTWGSITHSPASLAQSSADNLIWLSENTFTYHTNIKDDHELTILAGMTAQSSNAQTLMASDNSYPYNTLRSLNAGSGTYGASSATYDWSLLSYLARVNYIFKDKYLITGTIRADGSSRFGPENKYGVFPSGSVAWRISKESFMQPVSFISDMKIRASYGLTGNQEIGLYDYARLLATQNYAFGNEIYPGVGATTLPNPAVEWESVKQLDIGMDVAFFKNRMQFTADYFDKETNGMLLQVPIPLSSGYVSAAAVNAGTVDNKGVELTLSGQVISGKDFEWNSSFNITFIKNEVISLAGGSPIPGAGINFNQTISLTAVGHSIGEFYGYVTEGIFQSQADIAKHATQQPGTAPGDIAFKDLNHDGVIDDNDRTYIGNPIPQFTAGFKNTFRYSNFDLNLLITGVYGNKLYNGNRVYDEQMSGAFNQSVSTLNRWQSPSSPGNGTMPRAVWDDPNTNARTSDRYVENGSYLRVRNLTIGYKLPAKTISKFKLQQFRIYAGVQNLLTITKYQGFDPEVGPYQQSGLQNGVDNGTYPVSRTVTFGLNVGF
jgi:TonB-dependent starch-binding outer membrane protein SusC